MHVRAACTTGAGNCVHTVVACGTLCECACVIEKKGVVTVVTVRHMPDTKVCLLLSCTCKVQSQCAQPVRLWSCPAAVTAMTAMF